jgi:hypothetical protein
MEEKQKKIKEEEEKEIGIRLKNIQTDQTCELSCRNVGRILLKKTSYGHIKNGMV